MNPRLCAASLRTQEPRREEPSYETAAREERVREVRALEKDVLRLETSFKVLVFPRISVTSRKSFGTHLTLYTGKIHKIQNSEIYVLQRSQLFAKIL